MSTTGAFAEVIALVPLEKLFTYANEVQTVDGQAPSAPENTFPILGADGQGAGSSFAVTLPSYRATVPPSLVPTPVK